MSFGKNMIFFIFNQNFKNQMKISDEQSKTIFYYSVNMFLFACHFISKNDRFETHGLFNARNKKRLSHKKKHTQRILPYR